MAVSMRTPMQQLNDHLYAQVECVTHSGTNNCHHCKKCTHNFSGSVSRIHDHLKKQAKPGDVKGCTFSETNKKEVWDEINTLVFALQKTKKLSKTVLF
jgi:hypothetical protein